MGFVQMDPGEERACHDPRVMQLKREQAEASGKHMVKQRSLCLSTKPRKQPRVVEHSIMLFYLVFTYLIY